jgi:hypothetical protein
MLKRNIRNWVYALISGLAFAFAFSGALLYLRGSFENDGRTREAALNAVLRSGIACSRMLAAYGEFF